MIEECTFWKKKKKITKKKITRKRKLIRSLFKIKTIVKKSFTGSPVRLPTLETFAKKPLVK